MKRVLKELDRHLETTGNAEVPDGPKSENVNVSSIDGRARKGDGLKAENPVTGEILDIAKDLASSGIRGKFVHAHVLTARKGKDVGGLNGRARTIRLKVHDDSDIDNGRAGKGGRGGDAMAKGNRAENGNVNGTDLTAITGIGIISNRRGIEAAGKSLRRGERGPAREGKGKHRLDTSSNDGQSTAGTLDRTQIIIATTHVKKLGLETDEAASTKVGDGTVLDAGKLLAKSSAGSAVRRTATLVGAFVPLGVSTHAPRIRHDPFVNKRFSDIQGQEDGPSDGKTEESEGKHQRRPDRSEDRRKRGGRGGQEM